MAGCIRQLEEWRVTRQEAGGELPVPGVYGVPEQWPHISALYERAGFAYAGHTEIIYFAAVEDLRGAARAPIAGLSLRRTAGMNGTRLSAMLGEDVIGYIEVEIFDEGERLSRNRGRTGLRRLPGVPPGSRVPGTHPDQAGMDPDAAPGMTRTAPPARTMGQEGGTQSPSWPTGTAELAGCSGEAAEDG